MQATFPALSGTTHGEAAQARASDALRTSLSLPARALLLLTTRRWAGGRRYLPPLQAALFEPFERAGWLIRVATPRNFVLWRNAWTLRDTATAVAVLPDRASGLGTEAYTLLCMQELLRRIAKQALVLRGLPAHLSDTTEMLQHLRREALARVAPAADPRDADALFLQIETMLGEQLLGIDRHRGAAVQATPRPRDHDHLSIGMFF